MQKRTRAVILLLSFFCGWHLSSLAGQRCQLRADDFKAVTGPCGLRFPEDHAPHPGFRTEWWYYTGNLETPEGRHFGYQLTFFRLQLGPPGEAAQWPEPASAWRTQMVYLAHAALSDTRAQQHRQTETMARQALGLAGGERRGGKVELFVRDWSIVLADKGHRLRAAGEDFGFDLVLSPVKPLVAHGERGYSRKGPLPEQASCYYSFTRLATEGTLSVAGRRFAVAGASWMDHEYSSAPLAPGLAGWDWFSLQLDDNSELMVYRLRQSDGSASPLSGGTFVGSDGRSRRLQAQEIEVEVQDTWRSRRSGGVYPSAWRLRVPALALRLTVTPRMPDQEMATLGSSNLIYWEGSVRAAGNRGANTVGGQGYVELTGYAQPFALPR